MGYFVYFLRCRDDSLYCGYTHDLVERVKLHRVGRASKYTRSRLPIVLVYSEPFSTQSLAMKREAEIKSFTRKKKLDLINKR
ncbi:MAG: GIY-YIG nuclease family protein [Candidatus Diapherotrites archaeon]|uniref:GIY-YIG nuclease family protein n=1 Tax=Candidatus Iainarchaeum sp. TaxID=3101447 RepID=A0A8T4C729_9ARCH|nr:GIY-YIG nuclease family protein [Candidatus Diapherotrites archaeon]